MVRAQQEPLLHSGVAAEGVGIAGRSRLQLANRRQRQRTNFAPSLYVFAGGAFNAWVVGNSESVLDVDDPTSRLSQTVVFIERCKRIDRKSCNQINELGTGFWRGLWNGPTGGQFAASPYFGC